MTSDAIKAREARVKRALKICGTRFVKAPEPCDPDDAYGIESIDPNDSFRRSRRGAPPLFCMSLETLEKLAEQAEANAPELRRIEAACRERARKRKQQNYRAGAGRVSS